MKITCTKSKELISEFCIICFCTLKTANVLHIKTVLRFSEHCLYNKEFLCIAHTIEHNYTSPSSTVPLGEI